MLRKSDGIFSSKKNKTKKNCSLLQQMVAKLQSQYRSGKDNRGGDVRRGIGDGHTREREEISIWNPFSKSRNIDKY